MYRILVIRLGSMGDVIHSLPAVASLKHSFPHSHLSWIIKRQWIPLLEDNPFIDEIIPYQRTAAGIAQAWTRLRREHFQLAVDLQGLMQSALVAAAARPEKIVGLDRSQAREPLAALMYSTTVRTTSAHRVDRYLEIAAAAGATNIVTTFPLPAGRPEGELPEGRFVLACPLAGWASKQWPLEYYEELAAGLKVPLVLNGSPHAEETLSRVSGAHIHISGVSGLIYATRRASAVVGVDSGPLHLAAALSKPGVAIYGPTDPAAHGPYGGSIKVLRSPDAITSYKRRDDDDPSMRAIQPGEVLDILHQEQLA
ncbi:MAG: glycosyltransferase family 9 protein [Acidobacteriota bacterium]